MELKRNYCTTREQSRRLFDLGLNPDTSDMYYDLSYSCQTPFIGDYPLKGMEIYNPNCIQAAWSLHRLIDLFPCLVEKKQCSVLLSDHKHGISCIYINLLKNTQEEICFDAYEDLYENFLDAFEWAIDEGLVNKEYLNQ